MLRDDDLDPLTKKAKPRALDKMSVDDLREYMADLDDEKRRVTAEIAKKEKHLQAADALFRKRDGE
jgi:uncharacterized small protein (DUF1192 family)